MAQAISNEAVLKGTGKAWQQWCDALDAANAQNMSHKDIAQWLVTEHGTSHWWTQMLTVNYEQHIGRRVVGQDCTGKFRVSASKTINGHSDFFTIGRRYTVKFFLHFVGCDFWTIFYNTGLLCYSATS